MIRLPSEVLMYTIQSPIWNWMIREPLIYRVTVAQG